MSNLAHIHQQLAQETGRFLLLNLRAAIEGAAAALAEKRHTNAVERERLCEGFRSSAMAMDIFNHEKSRRKLGMEPAYAPELVKNLGHHASQLARHTGMLEAYGDPYVLEFYDRLQLRMKKALMRPLPDPQQIDDTDSTESTNPNIHFMAEPTPDRGYSALAKLDGRHAEMKAKALDHTLLDIASSIDPTKPVPKAAPVAPVAPVTTPRAEPATATVQDAIWDDPELAPEANKLWFAALEWSAGEKSTPPPQPTGNLERAIRANPEANMETIKMLRWLHQKDPPDK